MKKKLLVLKNIMVVGAFFGFIATINNGQLIQAFAADQTHNVTFHYVDKNFAEATEVVAVKHNSTITNNIKYVQSANGYYFDSWDKVGTKVTSDMHTYAKYAYRQITDDNHYITKNDDFSYTLTNLSGIPETGSMFETYNYYKDFELEFTILDNNTSYSYSRGPVIHFGDHLKYFLCSGQNVDGTKRSGTQDQPFFAALIYENGASSVEVIPAWYCAPMEATVKITVQNNLFNVFVKSGGSAYTRPAYWPADVSLGTYSTIGSIGFGFTAGSTGSYTLKDVTLKNLDAESDLFDSSSYIYDISHDAPLEVNVNTTDEIQSVWFGNRMLDSNEYSIFDDETKQTVTVNKDAILKYMKSAVDNKVSFCVYTTTSLYDTLDVSFEGFSNHVIKFVDKGTTINEYNVQTNQALALPSLPSGSIGWYLNGKKVIDSVIYPVEDMTFEAKYSTDMFNVTFVYRNLKYKEKTETVQYVYGTQITDDLFKVENPNGYIFTGWDYYGIVEEDITVTANYTLYSKAKDFSLDFNGSLDCGNYVDYVCLSASGGYTDLSNNYMEVMNLVGGSMLLTNQKYIDFEFTFDIVKFDNAIFGDNNIVITFGDTSKEIKNYYQRPFSIVIGLDNPIGDTYISTAWFLAGGALAGGGNIVPLCDTSKVSKGATLNGHRGFYSSGLAADGKYVQLKLVKQYGYITLYSKYNTDVLWSEAFSSFVGYEINGYLGYGVSTEYLHYGYTLGLDNYTVKNLNAHDSEVKMNIEGLKQDASGVYKYEAGSKDLKTNIDFKMQPYNGINVVIYDEYNNPVKEISKNIIREKIYEIGDYVTLNKRVLGEIFNQYSKNGKLRIDIIVILEIDWGKVTIDMTAPESLTLNFYSFGQLIETKAQGFGTQIVTPTQIETPYGYTFAGWVDEEGNEISSSYVVVDDMDCYASFEPFVFKITFLNFDGTVYFTTKGKFGDKVQLPSIDPISLEGAKFIKWDIEDLTITGDMVIKAKWDYQGGSLPTYAIVLIAVGGVAIVGGLAAAITIISLKKKKNKK